MSNFLSVKDFIAQQKDKMIEHWNDLWAKVKGR